MMLHAFGKKLYTFNDRIQMRLAKRKRLDVDVLIKRSDIVLPEIFSDGTRLRDWSEHQKRSEYLHIPQNTGGVNPGDQRALFYLVHALRPRAVLEIGTHIGASTVQIAGALAFQELPASFTTVDLDDVNNEDRWKKFGAKLSPREMICGVGYSGSVEFVSQNSTSFLKMIDRKFDFIFLDGSHKARAVYEEVNYSLRILNPGGVVVLHDYFPELKPLWKENSVISGPFLAIKKLVSDNDSLAVIPLGELPWTTKGNSCVTSLALLCKSDI